jgi:hypothetical protein
VRRLEEIGAGLRRSTGGRQNKGDGVIKSLKAVL